MIQQSLRLRARGWGGRRERAGRKPGPRPRIRHRSRPHLAARHPRHVTVRTRKGIPSLRNFLAVRELERGFGRRCERRDFRVVQYSIQGNHIHMIIESRDRHALGRGMKSIGPTIARAVHRAFRRRGRVLDDRYHMRALKTPREVKAVLAYVLLNARRHARRPARTVVHLDPASSARWFDGWIRGRLSPRDSPCVATPRTWLLQEGWRRHGLLDPATVPG